MVECAKYGIECGSWCCHSMAQCFSRFRGTIRLRLDAPAEQAGCGQSSSRGHSGMWILRLFADSILRAWLFVWRPDANLDRLGQIPPDRRCESHPPIWISAGAGYSLSRTWAVELQGDGTVAVSQPQFVYDTQERWQLPLFNGAIRANVVGLFDVF